MDDSTEFDAKTQSPMRFGGCEEKGHSKQGMLIYFHQNKKNRGKLGRTRRGKDEGRS